jgi:hypothetical protein
MVIGQNMGKQNSYQEYVAGALPEPIARHLDQNTVLPREKNPLCKDRGWVERQDCTFLTKKSSPPFCIQTWNNENCLPGPGEA